MTVLDKDPYKDRDNRIKLEINSIFTVFLEECWLLPEGGKKGMKTTLDRDFADLG